MYPRLKNVFEKILEKARDQRIKDLARKYGYKPYMIARYTEILGWKEAVQLLEINEKPLPDTIRCNDFLIECDQLVKRMEKKGYRLSQLEFPRNGFLVLKKGKGSLGGTHEYLQGYYYIQDKASMSIVHALNPQPEELIIDMAAAPGGKATQILQLTRDKAYLIAIEKNPRRIKALRSHLQRMRFTRYIVILGDARRINLQLKPDRILLDAPSTGEGIIRKDPTRKTSRTLQDLIEIHELQYSMLRKAVRTIKSGGIIVYSACSLAPEEGEIVINRLLEEHENVIVEPHGLPATPGVTSYFNIELDERIKLCGRFWPHIQNSEGFFVCRLRVS